MKNYSKVGNRKGKPAFRTPSRFLGKQSMKPRPPVSRPWDLAARLEHQQKREKRK